MELYYLQGWELVAEKVLQVGMLLFIVWNIKLLLFENDAIIDQGIEGDHNDGKEQN
ncbi:hypothetical protein [Mesobacillus campisalis]|uniref:hypothetical protein n=1 Tax=Mesobacillus campisalis TaxID=1408103 RepID=UPI000A499A3E|nr:hypothetical protein [Mesobacillus campisalis]